jgi:hypothetical protein
VPHQHDTVPILLLRAAIVPKETNLSTQRTQRYAKESQSNGLKFCVRYVGQLGPANTPITLSD